MRRIALTLLIAIGSGCSLFVSLDGLSGSDAVGDAGDGGDAAAATDAQSDRNASSDASTTNGAGFCDGSTHTFCADFDQSALLGWDGQLTDPTGQIIGSNAQSVSTPSSLLVSLPRRDSDNGMPQPSELTYKKYVGAYRPVVVSFDFFYVEPAWQAGDINCAIFSVSYLNGNGNGNLVAFLQVAQNAFDIIGSGKSGHSNAPLPSNQWLHAMISVDPSGAVSAEIGAQSFAYSVASVTSGPGSFTEVDLGINSYNTPIPAFTVYYDNVTIDLN